MCILVYKKIMIKMLIQLLYKGSGMGPTWNMITTFIKNGLIDMLTEAVERKRVLHGMALIRVKCHRESE